MNKPQAKLFAQEFLSNGMNATEAIRVVKPHLKQTPSNLGVAGFRAVNSIKVQRALVEVMEDMGLKTDEISRILKRNAKQDKNIPASNTAIDMILKVRGEYAPEKRLTLTANIKSEADADATIKELQEQLKRLQDTVS